MSTTKYIGDKGEDIAVLFLKENGYTILETNFRYQKSEIDIICEKNEFIVFVEVKTRHETRIIEPELSVDIKKQQMLIKGAQAYIEQNDLAKEARFDIVSVIYFENEFQIKHIEEAFYAT